MIWLELFRWAGRLGAGGLGRWLKLGLLGAVVAAAAGLVLWVRSAESRAATYAAEIAMLRSEQRSLQEQLRAAREERQRALRLLGDLRRKEAARRREVERLRAALKEIPNEGCLDRPLPDPVGRLLQ